MPHLLVYNEGFLLSVLLCPSTQRSPTSLCYFFRQELKKVVNIDTARFGIDKSYLLTAIKYHVLLGAEDEASCTPKPS